jgi:hypothetical protein
MWWPSGADPNCLQAFERLKADLLGCKILRHPDFNLPFIVQTDASNFALGAVLTQIFPDGEAAVAFAGKQLSKTEQN